MTSWIKGLVLKWALSYAAELLGGTSDKVRSYIERAVKHVAKLAAKTENTVDDTVVEKLAKIAGVDVSALNLSTETGDSE